MSDGEAAVDFEAGSAWSFLVGGGEMGARMRSHDWAATRLGPPETWPELLRGMVATCVNAPLLGAVLWGPDLLVLYNDACIPVLGARHPDALGTPAREMWADIWDEVAPLFQSVLTTGRGCERRNIRFDRVQDGQARMGLWDFSAAPIHDGDGTIVGLLLQGVDASAQALVEAALRDERRTLETMNRIGAAIAAELNLERVVQMVTDGGVELTGAQFGAFFYNVVDPAGGSYRLYTLSGVERSAFENFPMPRNTTLFAPTFDGERVVRSDDILLDPRYGQNAPRRGMPEGHLPVRSYLAVPVVSRSLAVLGALFFGHPKTAQFNARHEALMVAIAAQAAIAIDNARLFKTAQDEVEERRRAEAALQALNDTLEQRVVAAVEARNAVEAALHQSQKMEAVGQLTGGLAHDFNNLLTGITGSLELLQARVAQGRVREMGRYIAAAQGAAKRAAALTHRLLAFARRQTLDPKVTDVNRLVRDMEELIRRTIGPQIDMEIVLAVGGLWPTLVDPSQLENALLNLCINARDAMPGGGRLTIETAHKALDEQAARLLDLPPGPYVSLSVSDNGTGMTPDVIARAFDPFFTTKPIGQGTGLGLSMIYGFAKQSGGQVRIYSEVAQGTTIRVYLPRHMGAVDPADRSAALVAPPRVGRGETVLVIDDEPTVRMLVTDVLEEFGYTVIEGADGPAGLVVLRSDARIDLLVTDVGLPNGMNGRQLADAARALRPGLKVLFITGYAENAVLNQGHLQPGMQVLTKPFAMDVLAERVKGLIDAAGALAPL
jgi:signal transduction histidine kinase